MFQWLKNEPFSSVSLLTKPDEHLTGNLQEIDRLVQEAWKPFFQRYVERPSRQAKHTSMGPDGWRIGELKRLPDFLRRQLATVLNLIETCGRWPTSLCRAFCCLIPKSENSGGPLSLRPVSIAI